MFVKYYIDIDVDIIRQNIIEKEKEKSRQDNEIKNKLEELLLWYKIEDQVLVEQEKILKQVRKEFEIKRRNEVHGLHQQYGRQRILDINKKYDICGREICGGGLFN